MERITVQNANPKSPSPIIHRVISQGAPWLIRSAALFILLAQGSWAQVSLSLSSGGAQNGTMLLNFLLSSPSGSEPAGLQWTLSYPTASVTQAIVAAGAQANAASKSVTCNTVSGSQTCVVSGMNASKILNGVVATATLQLSSSTTGTPSGILVANALGALPSAQSIPISTGSTIQIVPVIRSLQCSPTSLTAPASASCTVTVSAAAPSGGTAVSLGTAAAGISVSSPASVTVASGQTAAVFSVSLAAGSASGTVSVSASLNGSSASSSFTVGSVSPVRVKAGGAQYTDVNGSVWSADFGYNGGTAASTSTIVSGTTDPLLYKTYRWEPVTLQYQLSMPNGTHTVNLYFAETAFSSKGARIFNIVINGQTVRSNLDIFATVGANKALILTFPVTVTNGQVLIQLGAVVQNPKINAIEILP